MNEYQLCLTDGAREDLEALYDFLLQFDIATADRALQAIDSAFNVLSKHPYICRKAANGELGSRIRELVIDFGATGYLALFEISDEETVTVFAVRHQRESDYR